MHAEHDASDSAFGRPIAGAIARRPLLDADVDDSEKLTAHHCVQDMEGVSNSQFIAKQWKKS